jgi:6-phosphogluconolactonase
MRFYIGTYTSKGAAGIYKCEFDATNGSLGEPTLAARSEDPSFLALHPAKRFLYAVNESDAGHASAFAIDDATGQLQFLNQQSTFGSAPCYVSIDSAGRCAMVANYSSGNVAVLPIQDDGQLLPASCIDQHHGHGPNPSRQEGPHAHCIVPDAAGRFIFSCDLGLDQILIYDLDAGAGKLLAHVPPFASTPSGAGPRHITFHPTLPFAYVITEMGNTLCTFRYNASAGTLTPVQVVSTLPADFTGSSHAAEVSIHPSHPFLYASNRGDDSITVFKIDSQTGELKFLSRHSVAGKNPRHFAIDPTGLFLLVANQDTNNIVVFKIDRASGSLSPARAAIEVPAPVCILFDKKN